MAHGLAAPPKTIETYRVWIKDHHKMQIRTGISCGACNLSTVACTVPAPTAVMYVETLLKMAHLLGT
jgi:hypothetical protein